jgi:hypothetical protein
MPARATCSSNEIRFLMGRLNKSGAKLLLPQVIQAMPDDLAPPPGSDRDWHWRDQEPDEKPLLPETERRVRLVVLGVAMAVLVGAVIGLATWYFRSQPGASFVLSLVVWEHSDLLYPSHAAALADSDAILQHFKNLQPAKRRHARDSQARDNLKSELHRLADEKTGTIIVHLSCQARTYGDAVYLLPSLANPDDVDSWLKLDAVLDYLNQCPAKKKLLLLDIVHPLNDTRLGIVYDDVADEVKKTLDRHPPASLLVLSACAPGQTALASPILGRSVFMHFVDQGLRGGADAWGETGLLDKKVSVKELASFVRHQTEVWAAKNHGVKQTPWLWGDGADFMLVDFVVQAPTPEKKSEPAKKDAKDGKDEAKAADKKDGKDDAKAAEKKDGKDDAKAPEKSDTKNDGKSEKKASEKEEPAPRFSYPAELKAAWALREQVAGHRLPPDVLLAIDVELLRIEKDWPDGPQDKRVERRVAAELGNFADSLQRLKKKLEAIAVNQVRSRPPSIAVATMALPEPDAAMVKALTAALKKVTAAPPKEATPQDKKEAEKARKEIEGELLQIVKDQKELPTKLAAWLAAASTTGNPLREQIVFVYDFLEAQLKEEAIKEYVETAWLKRVKAFDGFLRGQDNQVAWYWPAQEVGLALQTVLAAESIVALLAQDPELLRWLDNERFRRAEADRREGEKLLFWNNPSHWPAAAQKLRQAAQSYQIMHAVLNNVHSARDARRRALVQLPGFFLWLSARAESDLEEEADWAEAHRQMASLLDRLAAGVLPQNPAEIRGAELSRDLDTLARRQRERITTVTKPDKDRGAEALAVIRALRSGSGLSVEERARLWQTAHELAEDLRNKSPAVEDPQKHVPLSAPPRDATDAKIRIAAAKARAKLALELLQIAKVPGLDEAQDCLKALEDDPALPAWEKLGSKLRAAWQQLLAMDAPKTSPAYCFKCLTPVIGNELQLDQADLQNDAKWSDDFNVWLRDRYAGEAEFLAPYEKSEVKGGGTFFGKLAERLTR